MTVGRLRRKSCGQTKQKNTIPTLTLLFEAVFAAEGWLVSTKGTMNVGLNLLQPEKWRWVMAAWQWPRTYCKGIKGAAKAEAH